MWIYRRIFTCLIFGGFLLGCVVFLKLQLNDSYDQKPAPDFLPNVPRFRPARVCSTRAVVLVNSAPTHANRRQVIRETWAHPTVTHSLDITIAFGIGSAASTEMQRSVDWEAEMFGDIFQISEMDKPSTSAFKAIHLFKALRGACAPLPEFILKVDDDMFVNIFVVGELLEALETFSSSNTIWCIAWDRDLDNHPNNSTWIVQRTLLDDNVHPSYCLSSAYLITGRTMNEIIRRHKPQAAKLLLPEDVYVTEMLTRQAGTVHSLLGERLLLDSAEEQDINMERMIFASLKYRIEEDNKKLWNELVKMKLSLVRHTEVGL